MGVLHPRCAGLDVHKDTVVACIRCITVPKAKEVRTFATTTQALEAPSPRPRGTGACASRVI